MTASSFPLAVCLVGLLTISFAVLWSGDFDRTSQALVIYVWGVVILAVGALWALLRNL